MRALVSGASVAGTAAAYWLGHHGYSGTVVERHPGLRPGVQAIDVRGPALTVLKRMGLLAAAEGRTTRMRGASFVGADGLHSDVRRLVFGPEAQFVKRQGTHAAIFTVPNFLNLDYWQIWHDGDSTMAGVYSARNNTEARATLGFMDSALRLDYRDTLGQFAEVERRMAGEGWVRLAYILAGELAAATQNGLVDHERGFANYYRKFHEYIERTQWLATDNIPGGAPISREQFEAIVNSITLKDY